MVQYCSASSEMFGAVLKSSECHVCCDHPKVSRNHHCTTKIMVCARSLWGADFSEGLACTGKTWAIRPLTPWPCLSPKWSWPTPRSRPPSPDMTGKVHPISGYVVSLRMFDHGDKSPSKTSTYTLSHMWLTPKTCSHDLENLRCRKTSPT